MARLRLRFRSRTPVSIKIGAALFLALQLSVGETIAPTWKAARALLGEPATMGRVAIWIVLVFWVVAATLRLSRWPLVLLTALTIGFVAWTTRYMTLGVGPQSMVILASEFAAWLVLTVLSLPHWRRMNWRPLGYLKPFPDVAEEFS